MPKKHVLECNHCKGHDVILDAWCSLNETTGKIQHEENLESGWCRDCDGEIGFNYERKLID
jgi:hypothetical protein